MVRFGRAGWVAKDVVYLVAGVLALLVEAKAVDWSRTSSAPAIPAVIGATRLG